MTVYGFTRQRLSIDFVTLRHACPKGIYVTLTDEPLTWNGVVFVRKGPYANAILRFSIAFPEDYPARPPAVIFKTDVFHPLIAPLTTYTYTAREGGLTDNEKLPSGGLMLRHGFPEWYGTGEAQLPHIIEVLQYIRIILDTEVVIDSIAQEDAANPGAWHAWRSFRRKTLTPDQGMNRERSMSPSKQQPGGARRPGEWDWTGVWEDRVKKAVQASISDATLYGGDGTAAIEFTKVDDDFLDRIAPLAEARSTTS